MNWTRRVRVVVGAWTVVLVALTWGYAAHAQTTVPATTTTTRPTSTTRAVTSTSRPTASSATTTTRRPAVRLTFTASPAEGPPGTSITVQSVNQCRGVGSFYVLVSIGQLRAGSGAGDRVGNWRFNVIVPQMAPGTYELLATCLISRNGVDENAGIYTGPTFTVTQGSGPPEPTTPDVHKSDNTPLLIGLIVAIVVAIAALAWALWLRAKHRRATAGTRPGSGPGAAPPGAAPPGSVA